MVIHLAKEILVVQMAHQMAMRQVATVMAAVIRLEAHQAVI